MSEAKLLREQWANVIILLSHIGLLYDDKDSLQLQLRIEKTVQSLCKEENEEFYKLILSWDPGVIDCDHSR